LESQGSKSSNGASMNCLEYEVLLFPRAEFGIGLRVENVNVGVILQLLNDSILVEMHQLLI